MLIYLYTDTEALTTDFITDCLTWFPSDQVEYVRPATRLHDRRDRVASYLLLLRALEVWQSGIHDQPLQIEDFPTLLATAQRYKAKARNTAQASPHLSATLPHFRYGIHGKPSLEGLEGTHFNISHCSKAVALALHDAPVGIDVECRRKVSQPLIDKACNDRERTEIAGSSDPAMAFLRYWTCKESYTKYTGTGLTMDLPSILDTIPKGVVQHTFELPFIEGYLTTTTAP